MELPRERIIKNGPRYLDMSELLSIILNTGYKNESVFDLSNRIVREYGFDLSIFNSVEYCVEQLKIPTVKASQLCSCVEIGRRIFDKNEENFINSNKKIFDIFKNVSNLKNPELYIIVLNRFNKIISKKLIFIGFNIDRLDLKIIFKTLFEFDFDKFILVYIGDMLFSDNIIKFSIKIKEKSDFLEINFSDIIFINKNEGISLKNKGLI